jgi:hypothetical protein
VVVVVVVDFDLDAVVVVPAPPSNVVVTLHAIMTFDFSSHLARALINKIKSMKRYIKIISTKKRFLTFIPILNCM